MAKGATEIERDIRDALSGCVVDARGLWHEMRYLIEQSDRPGHLRRNGRPMNDGQLAIAAGCPSAEVARLLQELGDCGLIEKIDRCWVSRQLAALHERREKRRELTRSWRARGDEGRAVRRREKAAKTGSDRRSDAGNAGRVSRDTQCDHRVTDVCTPAPLPSLVSPPETPSLTPSPTPKIPVAAQPGRGAAAGRERPEIVDRRDELPDTIEDDGTGAMRPSGRRKAGTPQAELVDHFAAGFAVRYGGARYPSRSVDYVKAHELLKAVEGVMEDAKSAIDRYLADDWPADQRHPLSLMLGASMLPRYLVPAPPAKTGVSHGKRRDDASQRRAERTAGQFAEPEGKLEAIARRREAERAARQQRDGGDTRAAG